MSEDKQRHLLTFLKDRAGDYLRGVAIYDADSYETIYIRDDVRAVHFEEDIDRMIDRLR